MVFDKKKWRQENRDKERESRRKYKERNSDKVKKSQKKYETRNREKINSYQLEYQKKPEVRKINNVRQNTRYNNEKTGFCQDCHKTTKTEFHHISYNPNLFIELCKKCHILRHKTEEDISVPQKQVQSEEDLK